MIEIVEGWTAPIDYQLLDGAAPVDLTGATVVLSVLDRTGSPMSVSGSLSIVDAVQGKVRFTPSAGAITAVNSPWQVRFKVTLGNAVSYYPGGIPEIWIIRR